MSKNIIQRALLFSAMAAIAACSNSANKIGSTIKGDRLSVIEQARTLESDKKAEGAAPTLSREIVNLSWPQIGYDSDHAMPNAQTSAQPKILWKASLGEGSSSDLRFWRAP